LVFFYMIESCKNADINMLILLCPETFLVFKAF